MAHCGGWRGGTGGFRFGTEVAHRLIALSNFWSRMLGPGHSMDTQTVVAAAIIRLSEQEVSAHSHAGLHQCVYKTL